MGVGRWGDGPDDEPDIEALFAGRGTSNTQAGMGAASTGSSDSDGPAAAPAPSAAHTSNDAHNPCVRCGACCASFRVDFARDELQSEGGRVPDGLAQPITRFMMRLQGTDHARPRCAALSGTVGVDARCGIYEWRPSPCREFGARANQGQGDDACAQARRRHGLPPL